MNHPTSLTGFECIKAALRDMPLKPGVYRMLNAQGDVLYVGKAKHLKNRVSNYAQARNLTYRILRMIEQTCSLEIIVTGSEAEALLLEANLIKKYKPRYNILLRDDKSFPYICISQSHPYPRIEKHRGAQSKGNSYFGPFASAGAVNQTLSILQRAFLLRPCTDSYFANRSRPCLQYQIKRCSAPCVDYISTTDYAQNIAQAKDFLSGKNREVQERFAAQMQAHSDAMEYEKAAELRDRIRALTQVQQEHALRAAGLSDADVIGLHRSGDQSCIQVFFFRGGHHFGNQSYFPRHDAESTDTDILGAFIGQFYQTHTPPREILTPSALPDESVIESALTLAAGYAVAIHQPQRGDKVALVTQATANAKGALERRLSEKRSTKKLLESVQTLFALPKFPERIEVYDNSHIMGKYALGAMIVATPEGFNKAAYRRFNVKDLGTVPGDDYAMMREMFRRRFSRLQKEDPDNTHGTWPDLLLIDGGLGQLSSARSVLEELGLTIPYVAIAKGPDRNAGREQFFRPDQQPFTLPPDDATLHYLQRLRDEAHRFAIGAHRQMRAKGITHSDLDDITGIGATRKRALLHHFGSRSGVEKATLTELENVEGINKKIAQTIYDYFHG